MAITPGGRVGDASPLGTHGPRRLDDYVRMVAHALMRKRGFTKSHAIATAKNALKRWSRGGGHVRPQVRAGAAAHLGIQKAIDVGHSSTGVHSLVDLAIAEHDRRAFVEFATEAGLDSDEIDFAWSEVLHPRGFGGKWVDKATDRHAPLHPRNVFGPKLAAIKANDPLGAAARKNRRRMARAIREQQRRSEHIAKIQNALLEDARRFTTDVPGPKPIGRRQLRRKMRNKAPRNFLDSPRMVGSALSEEQRGLIDLAIVEAASRDIELAPHWKHGWIPLNEEALAIKLKKASGSHLGSGQHLRTATIRTPRAKDSFGRFRTERERKIARGAALESQYRAHVKRTDAKLIELSNTHATHVTHAIDNGDGTFDWSKDPERAAMHSKIVNNVYRRMAKSAKSERKALFLGGLPGAGKSTALKKLPGVNERDYVTVNPDIFKEELAKHGLVPNIEGMSPMEASGLVHEESSHLANMLAEKARRNGKNIAYDITMNSSGSVHKRLDPLEASGYDSKAVFVDIPFEMSQQRVEQRHRNGWLRYIKDESGKNLGQRLVPSSHVGTGRSKKGSTSANFDAFTDVKHRFGAYRVYDNSGAEPRLAETRGSF